MPSGWLAVVLVPAREHARTPRPGRRRATAWRDLDVGKRLEHVPGNQRDAIARPISIVPSSPLSPAAAASLVLLPAVHGFRALERRIEQGVARAAAPAALASVDAELDPLSTGAAEVLEVAETGLRRTPRTGCRPSCRP